LLASFNRLRDRTGLSFSLTFPFVIILFHFCFPWTNIESFCSARKMEGEWVFCNEQPCRVWEGGAGHSPKEGLLSFPIWNWGSTSAPIPLRTDKNRCIDTWESAGTIRKHGIYCSHHACPRLFWCIFFYTLKKTEMALENIFWSVEIGQFLKAPELSNVRGRYCWLGMWQVTAYQLPAQDLSPRVPWSWWRRENKTEMLPAVWLAVANLPFLWFLDVDENWAFPTHSEFIKVLHHCFCLNFPEENSFNFYLLKTTVLKDNFNYTDNL
jgi:hypothetical protein